MMKTNQMSLYKTSAVLEVLVFKTDLKTKREVKAAGQILDRNSSIVEWSVDIEDIDNVLRVVKTSNDLTEVKIIKMLRINGFHCEVLPD